MWLPLLPFNKLMKEKIPWEGELPLGTGPFVGFGPPLKIDPQAIGIILVFLELERLAIFLLLISLAKRSYGAARRLISLFPSG